MSSSWGGQSSQQAAESYDSSGNVSFSREIPNPVRRNRTIRPTVTVWKMMELNSQGQPIEPVMDATLYLIDPVDNEPIYFNALSGNNAYGWFSYTTTGNEAGSSSLPVVYQMFEFPHLKVLLAGSGYRFMVSLRYLSGQMSISGGHAHSSFFDCLM